MAQHEEEDLDLLLHVVQYGSHILRPYFELKLAWHRPLHYFLHWKGEYRQLLARFPIFLLQLLEFPSITLVICLLLKTGRRSTMMLFYWLGGISLTLTMFIPLNYFAYEWPIVALNLLGESTNSNFLSWCTLSRSLLQALFSIPVIILFNFSGRISAINTLAVCYIYSAEVFPTVVRNVGLGSSSFWARVGPMVRLLSTAKFTDG